VGSTPHISFSFSVPRFFGWIPSVSFRFGPPPHCRYHLAGFPPLTRPTTMPVLFFDFPFRTTLPPVLSFLCVKTGNEVRAKVKTHPQPAAELFFFSFPCPAESFTTHPDVGFPFSLLLYGKDRPPAHSPIPFLLSGKPLTPGQLVMRIK